MQPNQSIFQGIPEEGCKQLFACLQVEQIIYAKHARILEQGEANPYICVLKKGTAHAVRYTTDGREVDFALLRSGDTFGDALALSISERSPVSVYADSTCTVNRFLYQRLLQSSSPYAKTVLQNLAEALAKKFFLQQRRVQYLTCPTLREKILTYLKDCSTEVQRASFQIPFNREALAAFLCCDRSALSRELSRLQRDGLLQYRKNQFSFPDICQNN